jgi:hypothetical protein
MKSFSSPTKRVTVSLDSHLDYEFRKLASQKFKFEKGWYSKAISEAMDVWINYNEVGILTGGITNIARLTGLNLWTMLKNDFNSKYSNHNDSDMLNDICSYFVDQSPYIENLDYKIMGEDFFISAETPLINENRACFMVEELVDRCTVPLTVVLRAGIEDITNKTYKINNLEFGESNQIHFKRIDSPETSLKALP